MLSTVPPSVTTSFTQEAIESVRHDINNLKDSLPSPPMSSRQQIVVSMGEEVRELEKEVQYLVRSLQNSIRHKQILQPK